MALISSSIQLINVATTVLSWSISTFNWYTCVFTLSTTSFAYVAPSTITRTLTREHWCLEDLTWTPSTFDSNTKWSCFFSLMHSCTVLSNSWARVTLSSYLSFNCANNTASASLVDGPLGTVSVNSCVHGLVSIWLLFSTSSATLISYYLMMST